MPATHVALLRGINVGKAKRVAMADLRTLFEGLGFTDVRTLLNSGNVVFTSKRAVSPTRIEKALLEATGVAARVTVVTTAEFAAVVAENPLLDVADNPSRFLIAFLHQPTDLAKLEPLETQDWSPEVLALGDRVAYLWCPDSILESPLAAAVGRALKDGVTSRNWATVLKLHALATPESL